MTSSTPAMSRTELCKQLQDAANDAAGRSECETAINLCGQAIKICVEDGDMETQSSLLNLRANCHFELSRFEAALHDSEAVIMSMGDSTTTESILARCLALCTAGHAAYHMRSFNKALELFTSLKVIAPSNATLEMLSRTKARLREEADGSYDFEQMQKDLEENPQQEKSEYASFQANTENRNTASRGRGLFATKDFQLGDLVLCEKAFAVAFEKVGFPDRLTYLKLQVGQILSHSPTAVNEFYTLTDGKTSPAKQPQKGLISTEQIVTMVDLNVFDLPSMSTWHSLTRGQSTGVGPTGESGTGIWIRASLFNHSCTANVNRSHIGDMMIVRAARPIAKGEELFMGYIHSVDFRSRSEDTKNSWGFQCTCKRCQADATLTDEQHESRMSLIHESSTFLKQEYRNKFLEPEESIQKAEQFMQQLRATYSNPAYQGVAKLPLIDLGRYVADQYIELLSIAKAEQAVVTMLTDLGIVRTDKTDGIVLDLSGAQDTTQFSLDTTLLASRMLHKAKWPMHKAVFVRLSKELYRTLYGSVRGFETFADPTSMGWLSRIDVEYV